MGVICKETLTAVIATKDRRAETEQCIRSIYRDVSDVIVVIDDATTEDIESLEKKYGNVHVFRYTGNLGPARSVNVGVSLAETEYVYVLDSDAEVVAHPESSMERDDVAVIAPKVIDSKYIDQYTYSGNEFMYQEIPWFYGCAFIARKDVWDSLGGYNPDYFMYFNEPDVSRRIYDSGYRIVYNPRFSVIHPECDGVTAWQNYYLVRNAVWFAWEHLPFPAMVSLVGRRVVCGLRHPVSTVSAVYDAVTSLPDRNPSDNEFFTGIW